MKLHAAAKRQRVRWRVIHILRRESVRRWFLPRVIAATLASVGLPACAPARSQPANSADSVPAHGAGLVLQADEGERRVRRNIGKGPFILKVDRQNGGSPDLVMGYEDIAPGAEIQPHTHLVADEILFIHRGSGVAKVGQRESAVSAGATVYIPRNVQISVRNTGNEPLGVAFIFSKPGFEELMRDNSVLEGQPVTPISPEERDQIRKRHSWHTVFPPR
jgi:quercetin dioxygenase-like cupin family protein